MERNGDILTEFNNYYPERYQLSTDNFDLASSKMCKDDTSKSLFCDVPKSLKNNGILSSGFDAQEDEISLELKKHCLDLLSTEKTNFLKSDDHMLPEWSNVIDLYDFSSNNKMSLNTFISKDSFINGKRVLAASKTSFQIDNCYTSSKSAIASESSLDTSDGTPKLLEESSSSSIEEIFFPVTNNPNEVKAQYISRVESQHDLGVVTLQSVSKNPSGQNSPQDKSCIPELHKKESGYQRNDRAMPELLPTLICLDDDDSIEDCKEECPAVVSVADSPEMPKLIPFSAEAEEAIRKKTECLTDNVLPLSFSKLTPDPKTIYARRVSSTNPKNINYQAVDLQTCTRKLFPDNEAVNVEDFKAKYTEYLSPEKHNKEIGFSFSSSFKSVKESWSHGIKQIKKVPQEESDSEYSGSGNEDSDGENGNSSNCKSENSDSQKSFRDSEFASKMKKKKKVCSIEDEKLKDAGDSINEIRQPKVMLRRISLDQCSSLHSSEKLSSTKNPSSAEKITFEHCLPSNASDDDNSLTSRPECDDNSSNEGPEIEEIEGIRFFQFRSKRDMEEFNRKPMEGGIDLEMIVPTKTTDITQIKGWRNKYFASDSQCHYLQSDDGNSREESSQNAKSVPMTVDSTETKCLDFRNCLNDNKTSVQEVKVKATSADIGTAEDVKLKIDKTTKLEKPSSAMSAFVSKDLDDFLLNSSTLNVKFLEKLNPNIIPIPPDSTILGLGKLRKSDYELNTLAALKRRNMLNKLKEGNQPLKPELHSDDDSVITLSSSDESSSNDDIPVAKLPRGRKRAALSQIENTSPIGSMKRRKSDESVDSSQRLVLRLTKESKGAADGYKVSDISCEKQNSEDESSSSESSLSSSSSSSSVESETEELPDVFQKAADGTSPIIKEAIFLKDSEPKLLEEFLNNLNMLGTSKDVAMLVQSNQSYFSKGPVLQSEICSEALDALLTNKEFVDSKTKHTPKKKLKAWQKYLPKKLSKIQQQKITKVTSAPKAQPETENSPNLKVKSINKIVKVTSILKVHPETEKLSNLKHEKALNLKETVKLKKPDHSENLSKNQKPVADDVTSVQSNSKSDLSNLKEVPKIRKRRSRSAIELSDPLSIIERGKRSIRLPARYLDSAVLAAGTEWVSPIFVEDEKKSRKQLLDVLEKTALEEKKAQKQSLDVSEKTSVEEKKTQKLLDALGKVTPNTPEAFNIDKKSRKQLLNVLDKIMPVTENLNSKPNKKSIFLSSGQPSIKKCTENSVPNKPTKRQVKLSNASKKFKIDTECRKISAVGSSQNSNTASVPSCSQNPNTATVPSCSQNPNTATVSSSTKGFYLLPICSCKPCSRTVSYKKITKEFVCFNHSQQQENKNKSKSNIYTECTVVENVESPTSTLRDSLTSEIKIINSPTPTFVEESKTQNISSMVTEDSHSIILKPKESEIPNNTPSTMPNDLHSTNSESIKESEIQNNESSTTSDGLQSPTPKPVKECDIKNNKPSIVSENLQPNMTLANKLPIQKLPIAISTKPEGAGKIVFLLPYNTSGANNVLQNKVPVLPKEGSASSPIGHVLTSESRNKPPILARKSGPEISSSSNVLKSPTSNLLQSSPKVLGHPPNVSSAPIVFKLPDNQKSSLPLLYNSSQLKPIIPGQVLNKSVNVLNVTEKLISPSVKPNSTQQAASPQMVMTAYKVGGNVYLCQSVRADSETKSSPKVANATDTNANITAASLPSSDVPAKENLNSSLAQNKPPTSDLLISTVKDALDVPLSTLKTPPRKKSRKSPLSARVFKESPDNEKGSKDLSDEEKEVDVDTVDETFNPKTALRRQLPGYISDSDVSDVECNEIFTTNMNSLIHGGKEKSIKEKKRRLLIKKSFEKLKDTDPLFHNAHSCNEILDMAVYAVNKFKIKEMALRQAKRMLRLHNAKLLEKLAFNLKGVKDIGTRNRLKKRIITTIAHDWANYKNKKPDVLSLQKKTEKKSVDSSSEVECVQSVAGPAIETERVVSKQLDFEVDESHNINIPIADQSEAASKITEEMELPHVQLRILEMPANDQEEENVVMDSEVEIKMDEAQSPQEKEVNIPDNTEKGVRVEGENSDGSASDDDDPLIIDLDINTPIKNVKVSPQKEKSVLDNKSMTSPPPMREFPGLIPLFPPEFYEEDNPFAIDLSKFPPESKSAAEDSPKVDPIKNSTITSSSGNIRFSEFQSKASSTENSVDKLNQYIIQTATNQLNSLMANSRRKTPSKNLLNSKKPAALSTSQKLSALSTSQKPAALSTSPRNSIHRGCKDVKILHGVGDIFGETEEEKVNSSILERTLSMPEDSKRINQEEIVIDDSDDEPMEVEEPIRRMSGESLQPKEHVASIIEDITIDDDSQVQNVVS